VIKHKFWVAYYCFKDGLAWRGLIHDLSKLRPSEWFAYANYFYGPKAEEHWKLRKAGGGYYKPYQTGDQKFDFCWLLHQKRNDHHWQWWVLPEDEGGVYALPMKEKAIREMICDWRGAGRAQGYGDNIPEWYKKNKGKMKLHHHTRHMLEMKLVKIYGRESMKDILTPTVDDDNFNKESV
jgi:hypothetical protein